ncbi:MAG TPA: glycosyltransferase [Candidatus Limnocylindrales bacterium]
MTSGVTRRRVLHLINGEYFGGSARVLMNYLTASQRRSDVIVGTFFDGELLERCRALGIETARLRMAGRGDLRAVAAVARLARRTGADVIHTHQARNTLVGRLAGAAVGRPVVTHVHSPAFRESTHRASNLVVGSVDRVLARGTARFICVSNSLATELHRLRIPADRIRVVWNGVPAPAAVDDTSRAAARAALGIEPSAFAIGLVANLRPRKGADVLLRAIAAMPAGAHAVLVGQAFGDYRSELDALVRELGIGDRATFAGFRADVDRLLPGFDALALPARFGEGLPMVVLEAMAAGVPVVATPVEGIGEAVGQDAGILVPVDDPGALARALQDLREQPDTRRRLASAGRERFRANFTSDAMALGFEAVYDGLLA